MSITIEVADDAAAFRAACNVREEVFGRQCYRRLPRLEGYDPSQILTLVARLGFTNEPVAALSIVETTDDAAQHGAFALSFPDGTRVARYTQLAVLRSYRGLNLPARMITEARQRFVLPNRIGYTWLLFSAETARTSSFCRELRFKCGEREFATEYGRSRVLVREEQPAGAELAAPRSRWNGGANGFHANRYVLPQAIVENEWLAQ